MSWSNDQKFLTMTDDYGQNLRIKELPWSNGQIRSILTIVHGKIEGVMVMVNFLTIDHGVNSMTGMTKFIYDL